jgi:hypothetical protein
MVMALRVTEPWLEPPVATFMLPLEMNGVAGPPMTVRDTFPGKFRVKWLCQAIDGREFGKNH